MLHVVRERRAAGSASPDLSPRCGASGTHWRRSGSAARRLRAHVFVHADTDGYCKEMSFRKANGNGMAADSLSAAVALPPVRKRPVDVVSVPVLTSWIIPGCSRAREKRQACF